jgi:hypothetical protein
MKSAIRQYIYFFITSSFIIIGIITKFFLVDTDLGARFKNFNKELLSSDIIFIFAILLGVIGLIFHALKKSNKSTLNNRTIIISAILILPMVIVISLTPFLMTFYPEENGDSIYTSIFTWFTILATFATLGWIISIVATIIKQIFIILTNKA